MVDDPAVSIFTAAAWVIADTIEAGHVIGALSVPGADLSRTCRDWVTHQLMSTYISV